MSRTKWSHPLERFGPGALTQLLDEHDLIVLDFAHAVSLAHTSERRGPQWKNALTTGNSHADSCCDWSIYSVN